ncbi:MAG: hypothetical protein IPJ03_16845 [Ignavibacteriales bacterium]|nr:hypothetical protein [Ignavibacteriales bacterium]
MTLNDIRNTPVIDCCQAMDWTGLKRITRLDYLTNKHHELKLAIETPKKKSAKTAQFKGLLIVLYLSNFRRTGDEQKILWS